MVVACGWLLAGGISLAAELSIYDIQYTTDPLGASEYDGQIHDCLGGVVTHVWDGSKDRVYLHDPAHSQWGAIVVKDWEAELLGQVNVGDWVRFDNILIEEFRGTTFLQFSRALAPDVAVTVVSTGNTVPDPTILPVADLGVPANHAQSEPYESMVVTFEDVVVGQRDLGHAADNYELLQGGSVAWGSDYMNVDAGAPYHPLIQPGAALVSITGVVEQYTDSGSSDYYQLLTRSSADIVPEPAGLALLVVGMFAWRRR